MKKLFDDIKSARWAIMIIIAYFAFLKSYLYTLCPVMNLTGYPCPGCGITRALFRVLHLDFIGAWKMHPFIYPIIFLAVWFCYDRYITGKNMKNWFWAVVIVAIAMIIYYVWRMYMYFPGESPMSYYNGSVLGKIKRIIEMY